LDKKYIEDSVFRSRFMWLDQIFNGKWALFWSKSPKKNSADPSNKWVEIFDIARVDLNVISKDKHPARSSLVFCSDAGAERVMTVVVKTRLDCCPFGLDVRFDSKKSGEDFIQCVNNLILSKE
jgi:hypothetical protein